MGVGGWSKGIFFTIYESKFKIKKNLFFFLRGGGGGGGEGGGLLE